MMLWSDEAATQISYNERLRMCFVSLVQIQRGLGQAYMYTYSDHQFQPFQPPKQ